MGRGVYCRWNSKNTTTDCFAISIAAMRRHNALLPGRHGWTWRRRGITTGSISLEVDDGSVTFLYSTRDRHGKPQDVNKAISLTSTPCNYGGWRKWFVCGCGRRVGRLFILREQIACRHCLRLAYPTQNGDEIDRAWARITTLESRLKDDRYKPEGMHQKTFTRIKKRLMQEYYRKEVAFVEMGRRLFPWMDL